MIVCVCVCVCVCVSESGRVWRRDGHATREYVRGECQRLLRSVGGNRVTNYKHELHKIKCENKPTEIIDICKLERDDNLAIHASGLEGKRSE